MPDVPEFFEQRHAISRPPPMNTSQVIKKILTESNDPMSAFQISRELQLRGIKTKLTDIKRLLSTMVKHGRVIKYYDVREEKWYYEVRK